MRMVDVDGTTPVDGRVVVDGASESFDGIRTDHDGDP